MAQKRSNNSERHNQREKKISSTYVRLTNAYNIHYQNILKKRMKQNWNNNLFTLRTGKKGAHKIFCFDYKS